MPALQRTLLTAFILATLLALAACGGGRKFAALPPGSPAAFDPAGSDAKAIEIADQVLAAVGGPLAWDKAHELVWDEAILIDGTPQKQGHHAWDRWNGRHHYEFADAAGHSVVAMYELYSDVGAATADRKVVSADAKDNIVAAARKQFSISTPMLFLQFALKSPGVHLKYVEEQGEQGATEPTWDSIKVTFDPALKADGYYYVLVNKKTHLIDIVENVPQGKPDDYRIAYRWSDWQDVGGLKIATKRQNVGLASEQWVFSNIKVHGSADEDFYVPVVQ